jgi:hypothetical protein
MPLGEIADEAIFPFCNLAFLGYALLIFFPKWKWTRIITLILPGVFSALYLCLVVDWILKNPSKIGTVDFASLSGVVALFKDSAAVMAGWIHYIAFDLLTARFIVLDAAAENIPHLLVIPLIPLTLMLGPVGLFCYLMIKLLKMVGIDAVFFTGTAFFCWMMTFWIFVVPGSFRMGIGAPISPFYDKLIEEASSRGIMGLPHTIVTKFAQHPYITWLHVIPAGIWTTLAPFQLMGSLRKRFPFLHRLAGYVMLSTTPWIIVGVVAIIFAGLTFESDFPSLASQPHLPLSALGLSPFADSASSFRFIEAFLCLEAVWFGFTALSALDAARKRRFEVHRRWMVRHIGAGLWVSIQRFMLMVFSVVAGARNTSWHARAAFYDCAIIAILLSMSAAEVYLFATAPRQSKGKKKAS